MGKRVGAAGANRQRLASCDYCCIYHHPGHGFTALRWGSLEVASLQARSPKGEFSRPIPSAKALRRPSIFGGRFILGNDSPVARIPFSRLPFGANYCFGADYPHYEALSVCRRHPQLCATSNETCFPHTAVWFVHRQSKGRLRGGFRVVEA